MPRFRTAQGEHDGSFSLVSYAGGRGRSGRRGMSLLLPSLASESQRHTPIHIWSPAFVSCTSIIPGKASLTAVARAACLVSASPVSAGPIVSGQAREQPLPSLRSVRVCTPGTPRTRPGPPRSSLPRPGGGVAHPFSRVRSASQVAGMRVGRHRGMAGEWGTGDVVHRTVAPAWSTGRLPTRPSRPAGRSCRTPPGRTPGRVPANRPSRRFSPRRLDDRRASRHDQVRVFEQLELLKWVAPDSDEIGRSTLHEPPKRR
jgi:hypothetical protein